MKSNLILVRLDPDYCNYLRKFDSKVPYNYNKKELSPFIGVLFEVNNFKYFAPLSSPKSKYLKLQNKIDFLEIDNGKLGAINFNNMLPVCENNIIILDLDNKCVSLDEKKYNKLLKKQIYWLKRNDRLLCAMSRKLYDNYVTGTLNSKIAKRCCNFVLLEEKCCEYNNTWVRN